MQNVQTVHVIYFLPFSLKVSALAATSEDDTTWEPTICNEFTAVGLILLSPITVLGSSRKEQTMDWIVPLFSHFLRMMSTQPKMT